MEFAILIALIVILAMLFFRKEKDVPSIYNMENCKWSKWSKNETLEGKVFWSRKCKRSGIVQKSLNDPKLNPKLSGKR